MKIIKQKALALQLLCILNPIFGFSQFELNVRPMYKENTYGVFVRVQGEQQPSNKTATGTGQITLLMPLDAEVKKITNFLGQWNRLDWVRAPDENLFKNYLSIGLTGDFEAIYYPPNQETLLLTIELKEKIIPPIQLIDNQKDPFAQLPNSRNTNPGNELSAIDPNDNFRIYRYIGNYETNHLIIKKYQK